jgi:catechol-2,3-dioxygenase
MLLLMDSTRPSEHFGPKSMGVLASVNSLTRSVRFYCEVLQFEVQLQDAEVAILTSNHQGAPFLTLRETDGSHAHFGPESVGVRALFWQLRSMEALDAVEDALRRRESFIQRSTRSTSSETVVGLDPDRIALGFMASRDGAHLSVQQLAEIPALAYSIDR